MAELLIKIGNGKFKDGDIIHAFNDERIYSVHAQHICHVKLIEGTGLRPANTLLEDYLKNTSKYKFERISKKQLRRTDLITLDKDILSDKPNENKEHIWVQKYIDYALRHPRHKIFGTKGHEYWYGGNRPKDLAAVWVEIEKKTAHKKADYTKFPLGDNTLSKYYAITVNDFTNEEGGELEAPFMDGEDVVSQRKYKVDYDNLPGLSTNDKDSIKDETIKVDHRTTKSFVRANIVEIK